MKKRPLAYTAILIVLGEAFGLMGIWQGMIFVSLFILLAGLKEKNKGTLFLILICFIFYLLGTKAADALRMEEEKENIFVTVTGTVTKVKDGESPYFYLKTKDLGEKSLQIKVIKSPVLVEKGDVVEVKGTLNVFKTPTNPGEFHANHYYHSIGLSYQCTPSEVSIVKKNTNPIYNWSTACSKHLKTFYADSMKAENAAILSGILLGEKEEIEKEDKTGYQEAGISHILAISGLHMGCIGMGLFSFLRKRRLSYLTSATLSLSFLSFYTIIVGNSVSMERAFLMLGIVLIGEVMGRKSDLLTTLSLVAAIVVVKQPYVLLHSSFYLSFLAVYSLAVFPERIESIWKGKSLIKKCFLSGFCVQLGLFPVLLESNHYISAYSFLINFLVLFFFPFVLACAFILSLSSFILYGPSGFFLHFIEYFLEGIRLLIKINESLPFHKIRIPHNPWWWYGIYYLLVLFGFYILEDSFETSQSGRKVHNKKCGKKIQGKKYIFVLCLWLLYFVGMYVYHHQNTLHITVLDVGQGDGILIRQKGGVNLLIDGGSSSKTKVGEYILLKAMDYYGMEQIDYVFLSHLDSDHMNGVLELLSMGKIKHVVISEYTFKEGLADSELLPYLTKDNTILVAKGDSFFLNGMELKILSPDLKKKYENENEASMLMEVSYQGRTMLFTGDLGQETEEQLLKDLPQNIDVLKVAHHGSKYSSGEDFLKKINPLCAVISCGKNRYGHPNEETLERLMKAGVKTLRTDESGAVEIIIKDGKLMVFEWK